MDASAAEVFIPAQLHGIDVAIISIYLLGTLILGTYFGKYVSGATDFFNAGRALPFWAIGMSVVATDISATDFIATAGAAYTYGIAAANFDWMGSMPAMVFAAFFFIPYYWRAGVYTIPEFLGRRYNVGVQMLHAAFWGLFLATMLAVMLYLTSRMMHTILGWDQTLCVWLLVVTTGIYVFSGGLAAVVMTDVVQLVVMFVGGGALLAISLYEVGGFGGLIDKVTAMPGHERHFNLLLPHDSPSPYPWSGIVFGLGIVMATGYMAGNQSIVQRNLGARTEWDAKAGMLFAGFLKFFIPWIVIIPGLCAIALLPHIPNGDDAVPTMIREYLPPGIRGLMFSALFAALMSTVDSNLNSATTIWTTDLYGRTYHFLKGRDFSQRHGLIVGRIFTVVFIVLGGLGAPLFEGQTTMYNFIQTSLAMFQGPVFAVLFLGILWKRANRYGALAALILGVTFTTLLNNTTGVFPSENPFLFMAWWSFVFSLAVCVAVSLLTPPEPEEKIRGLVFGQVVKDGEIQRVLHTRVM